jgi:glycine hydroxymethyltransferase
MHVIAAKALAFKEALLPGFSVYQQQVVNNARVLAQTFTAQGYAIVSGGTDNHLCVIDLRAHPVTGKAAEAALGQANITENKNAIPNDPQSPFITSGVRLGTPAVTTRGFKETELRQVGQWIMEILATPDDLACQQRVKDAVLNLCHRFPVYT